MVVEWRLKNEIIVYSVEVENTCLAKRNSLKYLCTRTRMRAVANVDVIWRVNHNY